MEDAKLQALHDTLSQIRGRKGLGTNSQFSWQRSGAGAATQTESTRHPSAAHLPDNALYAHFLPEGVYDPNSNAIDYGDGRIVKRDFSDAIMDDKNDGDENRNSKIKRRKTKVDEAEKTKQKEIRKAEKKAVKKAEKLKAKLEEKKRQMKLEKKLKKDQLTDVTVTIASSLTDVSQSKNIGTAIDTNQKGKEISKAKGKKKKIDIVSVDNEDESKKGAKRRKKAENSA